MYIIVFNKYVIYYRIDIMCLFSLAIMIIGAIFAGFNDLEFNMIGYFWMLINCISTSGYILYMRYASINIQLSKFEMVYYNNVLSIVFLLPFILIQKEYLFLNNIDILYNPYFIFCNIFAGFLGFFLNFASLWCVASTSATTYSILGAVNKVPITILGFIIFKAKMTYEGILFVCFATLGGFLYAYSKLTK